MKKRKARTFYVVLDADGSTWYVSSVRKRCKETLDDFNWGAYGCKIIKVREVMRKRRVKK